MNISKYIELLRFYVTQKMEGIENTLKYTILDEVRFIVSSLLSAILSLNISKEAIEMNGICGIVLRVVVTIVLYLILYQGISKAFLLRRSYLDIKRSDKRELSYAEAKSYVDNFDHIACDGVLLAQDFLKRAKDPSLSHHEQNFSLIEALYYYKKSLDVTALIVDHSQVLINNPRKDTGVSLYRLINIYYLLNDLHQEISKSTSCSKIAKLDEMEFEITQYKKKLNKVKQFVEKI